MIGRDGREKVGIREAGRRLGVSDTAVHKAIKSGRLSLDPESTERKPLLDWLEAERRWTGNSDVSKRSHVGPQGSPRRAGESPRVKLPTSSRMDEGVGGLEDGGGDGPRTGRGGAYAQARAMREVYEAKLAKLKLDRELGKYVENDAAKVAWFKHITAAKTRILGIAAACKSRYPELPLPVVAMIDQIAREALEDLANADS